MANYGKMKVHKAKENQRGIRDEVRTLDASTKRGSSSVNIEQQKVNERKTMMKDPAVKEQLLGFLFGNEENPLQDITSKYNKKIDELNRREYKNISIVGI